MKHGLKTLGASAKLAGIIPIWRRLADDPKGPKIVFNKSMVLLIELRAKRKILLEVFAY